MRADPYDDLPVAFPPRSESYFESPAPLRPPREPAAVDDLPTVYTVGNLAELPSADEQYIIGDGILTVGGKLLIYAKSGAGKTTLLDFLAGPLSTGAPFLGRYPVERALRVLVVQGELSLPEMSSHAQQLVGAGFDSDALMFVRMTKLKLPEGRSTSAGSSPVTAPTSWPWTPGTGCSRERAATSRNRSAACSMSAIGSLTKDSCSPPSSCTTPT